MNCTIDKQSLVSALAIARSIADKKSTMPILANVLLRAESGKLIIAATDLNLTVTAELPAQVGSEGGITLGARHLHEIVKALPSGIVSLRRADNQYAEVRAGRAEYKVVGMADKDFPKLPKPDGVKWSSVKAGTIASLIKRVVFACSTDETRYHLNGALLVPEAKALMAVATDGHRLSLAREEASAIKFDTPKTGGDVLVPRKGLAELARLAAEQASDAMLDIGIAPTKGGHLFCRAGSMLLVIKLIEAQFPPYANVIPAAPSRRVTVGRLALVEAIGRVSLMSSDKTQGIRLSGGNGAMQIQADNPDLGECREEVEIDHTGSGAFAIAANARYLLDALGAVVSDRITLGLDGELDPIKVTPAEGDEYVAVVMPMRD